MCLEWEGIKLITCQTFIISFQVVPNVAQSVALLEYALVSLDIKNSKYSAPMGAFTLQLQDVLLLSAEKH